MNKVIMMGRLTRDPECRNSAEGKAIARFSLAVDRPYRREAEKQEADFFTCTAFGKQAEFVEKYLKQGTRILISGRVQNDNYTNREGQKVYSTQIIIQELEFCESKKTSERSNNPANAKTDAEGFMNIPDGLDDEELPFS